jgi:hypothetical protein
LAATTQYIGQFVRYRALLDAARLQEEAALKIPSGEQRDDMLTEALAMRARALELEQGS